MQPIDQPGMIRPGEEIATGQLESYLKKQMPELTGRLEIAQFPGGYSNLTYMLRIGEHEMVLRRPPPKTHIATAHDMGREFRVLSGLRRVYAKVPRPLHYCEDASVIGTPFYLMERLAGFVMRAENISSLRWPAEQMRSLALATIDNLAAIHALDINAAGLQDLGRPAGYAQRQVRGWIKRYRDAQTDNHAELEAAIEWLERQPIPESDAAIIHNDYKYDNLLLHPDDPSQILAVFDWEMCTLGDPLMDLGTTLGYWTEPGDPAPLVQMFGLTTLPGNPDRSQVVERYAQASGRELTNPLFYYVYGLVKVAVIIQQLYARFRQGQTRDPRYARLGDVVQAYGQMATQALARERIHHLWK